MVLPTDNWPRLKEVFAGARALPADRRPAYLAEACAGNDALRQEVESLLASDQRAKSFLEAPAVVRGDDARDQARLMMEGQRLGVYQVQALLGAGGMGEVYRARDTKLERDVAVKFLPHAFTSDPERLARFEREARMLAALNHPNIGAIYGFEEVEGIRFLVLELVDGQTLADTLADVSRQRSQGPGLPIRDALSIARQIAEALDIAHEKGIIHRDLKPANITITRDGVVKVLDFGLAKAAGDGSTPDLTHSPTKTVNHTSDGAVMGTPGYMSPEQARGQVVDKRTDIWAFGCVLYEMLTGRVAFKGGTVSDTIVAVLASEPEWDALPGGTPASVRLLLQRCLDKDPKRRLRDLGDVRFEIDEVGSHAAPGTRQPSPAYRAVLPIVVTFVLLAGGAGLFYLAKPTAPVTSPSEYTQLTNFTDSATAPSLSPDGRMVTFKRGGTSVLEPRSDLRQAASERRVGTAHDLCRAQVRTGVHAGRIAGRVYRGGFRCVGYLDCSGARGPARAAPAQRLRTHLDCRSSGAVLRDQVRPPHGDCDRDGGPGGLERDLYQTGRARDGALLLRVSRPSVGARGRDERRPCVYSTVPAGTVRWKLCWPAGWTSGHLSVSGLVSRRTVDVLRRGRWGQLAPLAPEVS